MPGENEASYRLDLAAGKNRFGRVDRVIGSPIALRRARELGTAHVPEIASGRVRIIWASDFWDGPLSGIAEVDGASVFFTFAEDNDDDESWYRRLFLVRLPLRELEALHEEHAAFQRHVGTHFDYGIDGRRESSEVLPQSGWSEFYEAYPTDKVRNYLECEVLGWFSYG